MSRTLAEWVKKKDRTQRKHRGKRLSAEERLALHRLRREAKASGARLKDRGRGGLSPSLVLHVMRRDEYTCKVCGKRDHPISLHHKGGIVESKWLSKKGHKNEANNLVTICEPCHDTLHNEAREEGVDSSQITPEGDK